MKKTIDFLLGNFNYIALAYLALLLITNLTSGITLNSDSLYYYKLAIQSYNYGTFYPTLLNLYDPYLVSVTYVNIQIILFHLTDNTWIIIVYNVLVIGLTIYFLYRIIEKISGKNAARISVLVYISYPATAGLAATNLTELTFCMFMILSIWFYIKNTDIGFLFTGIFAALSTSMRPVGIFLFIALASVLYYRSLKGKKRLLSANLLTSGFLLTFVLFYGSVYLASGLPAILPSTGGVNLLIGANDFATGGYEPEVFKKGNPAHIAEKENITFFERDVFYRNMAMDWIKENPGKWLSLIPARLYYLLRSDIYAVEYITDIPLRTVEKIKALFEGPESHLLLHSGKSYSLLIIFFILLFLNHIYYFKYVILFIIAGLVKQKFHGSTLFAEVIIFICSGLLLTMITFGSERFKYPYIIAGIILLAPVVENFLRNKLNIKIYD